MSDDKKKEEVDLWGDDTLDDVEDKKDEKEEENPEEQEGKPEKTEIDQELTTEEEKEEMKKDPSLKTKARVRQREDEKADYERRLAEQEAQVFQDDDFQEAMKLQFSDNEIEIEGEKKSVKQIAEEYPDVAALIKDLVGQVEKKLGVPLQHAQEYIEDNKFWEKVQRSHPNARSMSDNKEFMEWVDGDDDVKTLASTGNPDDVIFILDLWKEKTTPKVDKAKEAKKNILKKSQGSSGANVPSKADDDDVLTEDKVASIWG